MACACPYHKSSRGEQEAHGKRRIRNVMLEEQDEGRLRGERYLNSDKNCRRPSLRQPSWRQVAYSAW